MTKGDMASQGPGAARPSPAKGADAVCASVRSLVSEVEAIATRLDEIEAAVAPAFEGVPGDNAPEYLYSAACRARFAARLLARLPSLDPPPPHEFAPDLPGWECCHCGYTKRVGTPAADHMKCRPRTPPPSANGNADATAPHPARSACEIITPTVNSDAPGAGDPYGK